MEFFCPKALRKKKREAKLTLLTLSAAKKKVVVVVVVPKSIAVLSDPINSERDKKGPEANAG